MRKPVVDQPRCPDCGHRIVVEDGIFVGHYPTPRVTNVEDPLCRGSWKPAS